MSEEKKQVSPEQAPAEATTTQPENKPDVLLYTQAEVQKMVKAASAKEAAQAVEAYKQELEAERVKQEQEAKEAERTSLIDQINSDEKLKRYFTEINENFSDQSLDYLSGIMKAHSIQKTEFESKNTAKPIGAQAVGKPGDMDSFFDKKLKEMRENRGRRW